MALFVRSVISRPAALGAFRPISSTACVMDHVRDMGGAFKEREAALENTYFNKHEREVLNKLAEKLRRKSDPTLHEHNADKQAVTEILKKHHVDVKDNLVEAILNWHRTAHH
eukprot:TRINITY_DN656_c0_g1::TRINITY_DN656_c0_g1_i1::g.28831::m.28831 TRINITY_DN656_c0_g1::TRINITY_DN656_c0_g1_i1::g.28831  ORF type:complete len:125 (+),score=36.79,IATP/PF04568.7/1.7e-09,Mis14/PF08641.7/0.018 TRINITY_DN656_c0_g1_i1:41-376(+)